MNRRSFLKGLGAIVGSVVSGVSLIPVSAENGIETIKTQAVQPPCVPAHRIPEIDLHITSATIKSHSKKLKAVWTIKRTEDLPWIKSSL